MPENLIGPPGAPDSSGLPPKRSHRATGKKPPGGKRVGAGRPKGARNALPQGSVAAVKACGLRVPKGASEAERAIAERTFQRIVDVMEEKVGSFSAFSVLTAARALREEVCGKVAEQHEVSGKDGGPVEIVLRDLGKEQAE